MKGWVAGRLADVPEVPTATDPGDPAWRALQHHFGVTAFGLNIYTARAAGDTLVAEHDEAGSGQEEVYLVASGRIRFTLDGVTVDAEGGHVVAVLGPAVRRAAVAVDAGAELIAIGAAPGCFSSSWRPQHFEHLPRHPDLD